MGRVRVGSDPEGALGGAGPRPHAADDPRHAVRLPRQEGAGQRRHRVRDRRRARPARAVHLVPDDRVSRRVAARRRVRPDPYQKELDALLHQFGRKIGTLITEPYLGGGGSYHPPKAYLQLLERFCRENDIVFILDEVQSNFGRTGAMFAFETYGIEPDIVVLGKGLGNGVPVAAAVGRADIFAALDYGEGSDTWSANPLCCAAVLATLDEFESRDVLGAMKPSSPAIEAGLVALKEFPFVANVRGERGGMVWGVEMKDHAGRTAAEWANAFVLACYHGDGGEATASTCSARCRRRWSASPRRWSSPETRQRGAVDNHAVALRADSLLTRESAMPVEWMSSVRWLAGRYFRHTTLRCEGRAGHPARLRALRDGRVDGRRQPDGVLLRRDGPLRVRWRLARLPERAPR